RLLHRSYRPPPDRATNLAIHANDFLQARRQILSNSVKPIDKVSVRQGRHRYPNARVLCSWGASGWIQENDHRPRGISAFPPDPLLVPRHLSMLLPRPNFVLYRQHATIRKVDCYIKPA